MNTKKYVSVAVAVMAFAGIAVALPASAATTPTTPQAGWMNHSGGQGRGGRMMGAGMKPGIIGTVATIDGTTLTVNARQGFGTSTPTTLYTVDASNATVRKDNATSTVSSIAVGDTVAIQGTITGTSVTATTIRDGVMPMRGMGGKGMGGQGTQPTSPITGNGQPVVAGSVTAISGTTLTITNKSNVTYTIDASNAKIAQGSNTIAISSIAVGDNVVVQGTVNGTSVVASSVIDQPAASAPGTPGAKGPTGFFAGIGQFFKHLFGF